MIALLADGSSDLAAVVISRRLRRLLTATATSSAGLVEVETAADGETTDTAPRVNSDELGLRLGLVVEDQKLLQYWSSTTTVRAFR